MSYKFFENTGCEYYPCHKAERINCLFCFCPLYNIESCGGDFTYTEVKGKRVKDCSGCTFPHNPESYEKIIEKLEKGC